MNDRFDAQLASYTSDDVRDAKYRNLVHRPPQKCRACAQPGRGWHVAECPHATADDHKLEIAYLRNDGDWLRRRAGWFLEQLRACQGKLAQVKEENRGLRRRLSPGPRDYGKKVADFSVKQLTKHVRRMIAKNKDKP